MAVRTCPISTSPSPVSQGGPNPGNVSGHAVLLEGQGLATHWHHGVCQFYRRVRQEEMVKFAGKTGMLSVMGNC